MKLFNGAALSPAHRIVSIDLARWLSALPYLPILRTLVILGILIRFELHGVSPFSTNLFKMGTILLGFDLVFGWWLHFRSRSNSRTQFMFYMLIVVDVAMISFFYWTTTNIESDFFLFYYLPIFTAAEYLGTHSVVAAFLLSSVAFAGVALTMEPGSVYKHTDLTARFLRVFLPREVFLLAVILFYGLAVNRAGARGLQMQSLLASKKRADELFSLPDILQDVLDRMVVDLGTPRCVGLLATSEGGDISHSRAIRWAGSGAANLDNRLLEDCDRALLGDALPSTVRVLVRGHAIGALAFQGPARAAVDSSDYLNTLADHLATAYERVRLLTSVREIAASSSTAVELNLELDGILDHLVSGLGFEFATISLVDEYMDQIRTVRGRNVPPAWVAGSVHLLSDKDIQADIVRTGKTEVLVDLDPRFDWRIWVRFNHARLARVFAPLVHNGTVVGTIEAGCDLARADMVLERQNDVTNLGLRKGEIIARTLPSVLLELVAKRATALLGADSASVHVFEGDTQIMLAGAGKADKRFLHRYTPRPHGIGSEAMRTRRRQVRNSVADSYPALAEEGILSMAAFPLHLGRDIRGILYVHHWREHIFTDAELELGTVFAAQIEIIIQNHLFFREAAGRDQKTELIIGLQNIIHALASNRDLDSLLEQLAFTALSLLDAKNVTLYQYFQQERQFSPCAVIKGLFEHPELMRTETLPDDVVWKVVAGGESLFLSDVTKHAFLNRPRAGRGTRVRFVERERIKSSAMLVLRSPYEGDIVGCLFANYGEARDLESPEYGPFRALAASLASSAGIAIKTARLHSNELREQDKQLRRMAKELAALRAIDGAIVASTGEPGLAAIAQTLLDQVFEVLGAEAGDLTVWNPLRMKLEVVAHRGYPPGHPEQFVELGAGLVGSVADGRLPEYVSDTTKDERYRMVNPSTRSELTIPLLDGDTLLGVLNVEHSSVNAFSDEDRMFLQTLAIQAVIALRSATLYRRIDRQLQQALTLSAIAARIQAIDADRDAALQLLLTGVTAGEGLGFSRAMLFVASESQKELVGTVAIGACTQSEADEWWTYIEDQLKAVATTAPHTTRLEWLLDSAVRHEQSVLKGDVPDTRLAEYVKTFRMPTARLAGVLAECLKGQAARLYVVPAFAADPIRSHLDFAYGTSAECAIGCYPIRVRDSSVAILVVDNRFHFEESILAADSGPILAAFGEFVGMTIESARLKGRLAAERQLADWRDITERVAHAFRYPLDQLGFLATGLDQALTERRLQAAQRQLELVQSALDRAQDVLSQFRDFAQLETEPVLEELELGGFLLDLLAGQALTARTNFQGSDPPVLIRAHSGRLAIAFSELFANAEHAMLSAAVPDPLLQIRLSSEGDQAIVDVIDNGPGVEKSIEARIFAPFFTTKRDSRFGGTGVGLANVRTVIEQHGGAVEYRGAEGGGARFVVMLPRVAEWGD